MVPLQRPGLRDLPRHARSARRLHVSQRPSWTGRRSERRTGGPVSLPGRGHQLDPGPDARRRARPAVTFISGYSLSEDYAGHLQRIGAFAIDLAILTAAGAGIALAAEFLAGGSDPVTIPLLSAFQLLMPWFYYAAMESSAKGATIGKMILGIRVADAEGYTPTFGRAALRAIPKCIPVLWPGYLAAVFTQRRQAFHDLIARTLVVRSE
ncbi:MAG: RDD family protein [Gemmatimonadetes bacterium]|nr:RDD family protein [Gemmatimonadota bacterium]